MIPPIPVRDVGYSADSLRCRVDDLDVALRLCGTISMGSSSWATDGPERIVVSGRIRVLAADIARLRTALESVLSTIHIAEGKRTSTLRGALSVLEPYVMSGPITAVSSAFSGQLWAAARPLMSLIIGSLPPVAASTDSVIVRALPQHTTAAPDSVASRVARIPGGDTHIRIERYLTDGGNRFEIYLSGTNFFGSDAEPWNFASNLKLAVSDSSPSLQAVRIAMASAGITRDTPVVFTAHSQGGLIALALANSGDYDVDAIITVGTPVGAVPDSLTVPTIHVVHPEDPVPAAGGTIRPTSFTWVVPTAHGETLINAHHRAGYVPSVAALDDLHDPRVDSIVERIQSTGVGVTRDYLAEVSPERPSP